MTLTKFEHVALSELSWVLDLFHLLQGFKEKVRSFGRVFKVSWKVER